MLSEKIKRYGGLGTHDVLKLIALASMLVDHLGAFFSPHEIELRIFGRMAAPIFFFLIGYSQSYRIRGDLVAAALFMVGFKYYHTSSLFESSILVNFILIRLFFSAAEKQRWRVSYPGSLFLLLVLLWPFTAICTEYGTIGWVFALCGYAQKNSDHYSVSSRFLMMAGSLGLYGFDHIYGMQLNVLPAIGLGLLLSGCGVMFWFYRPRTYEVAPKWQPVAPAFEWPARYTLWIYVVHLVVLEMMTGYYGYPMSLPN